MEVLDIVQSAAFKCGLISSFNPDELPEDYLSAGRNVLMNEVLPSLNCDRMIDITVTSRVYRPSNGKIILKPFRQPNDNTEVIGYTDKLAIDLADNFNEVFDAIAKCRPDWVDTEYHRASADWPRDDLNHMRTAAIWTRDMHLCYIRFNDNDIAILGEFDANIDFPPMRVDAVMDENSRMCYDYKYRDEFEYSYKYSAVPCIYTTEEYDDCIVILFNGTNDAKRIILPVPLQIINVDAQHAGTIIAPEKFRRFLIDSVAVSLAIVYGLSTLQAMQEQAAVSYNLLKKNKPQPLHDANPSQEICNKLRINVLGRRFYANI